MRVREQRTQGGEAVHLVVQARRREELVVQPPDLRALRIAEGHLKVVDRAHVAAELTVSGAANVSDNGGVCTSE